MAETDETYSAKQVATRIGTDPKTFRKWLRSTASPYEAVGQGQRYDFPKADLPKIAKQFNAWKSRSGGKLPRINGTKNTKVDREPDEHRAIPTKSMADQIRERETARDEEYGTIDGEEPTLEDLEELEDLDLDDLDD